MAFLWYFYSSKCFYKGDVVTIDGKNYYLISDDLILTVTLPAGGADNINPTLLLSAFGELPYYTVTKIMVYDTEMKIFE